jgi:hypothetical protein
MNAQAGAIMLVDAAARVIPGTHRHPVLTEAPAL